MKTNIKIAVDEAKRVLRSQQVSENEAKAILDGLSAASKEATPWWVVVLKTLAYLIGLLLAGYGTSAAAQSLLF